MTPMETSDNHIAPAPLRADDAERRLHPWSWLFVLGDDDGVACVPFAAAETVLAATQAKHAAELEQMAEIEAGKSDRAWVDAALRKLGCEIES